MNTTNLKIYDGRMGLSEESINKSGYEVVCWPDSQLLMDSSDWVDNCELINDEEGLDIYGSSAYVVPTDWYTETIKSH